MRSVICEVCCVPVCIGMIYTAMLHNYYVLGQEGYDKPIKCLCHISNCTLIIMGRKVLENQ